MCVCVFLFFFFLCVCVCWALCFFECFVFKIYCEWTLIGLVICCLAGSLCTSRFLRGFAECFAEETRSTGKREKIVSCWGGHNGWLVRIGRFIRGFSAFSLFFLQCPSSGDLPTLVTVSQEKRCSFHSPKRLFFIFLVLLCLCYLFPFSFISGCVLFMNLNAWLCTSLPHWAPQWCNKLVKFKIA